MEDIAEMMMNEGRFYGNAYEDGKDDGKKETELEIAKNMLAYNVPIELISKYTGVTNEQIQKLR